MFILSFPLFELIFLLYFFSAILHGIPSVYYANPAPVITLVKTLHISAKHAKILNRCVIRVHNSTLVRKQPGVMKYVMTLSNSIPNDKNQMTSTSV